MASNSGGEVVVVAGHPHPGHGPAVAGDGGDHRELDGRLVGVEVEEQLVDLVEHLVGPGVGRSTLLRTTTAGSPAASAFEST